MEYNFDIFEKFSDGKVQWRGCVASLADAQLKLGSLAKWSKNDFYATDLTSGAVVASARLAARARSASAQTRFWSAKALVARQLRD